MKIIVKSKNKLSNEQLEIIEDHVKKVLNGETGIVAIRDDINITVLNRKNKIILDI